MAESSNSRKPSGEKRKRGDPNYSEYLDEPENKKKRDESRQVIHSIEKDYPSKRITTSNQYVIQMSKGQDHAVSGEGIDCVTKEKFTFHVIFDGHGTDSCINCIRDLSLNKVKEMSEMMAAEDPVQTLAKFITDSHAVPLLESSGSTMCMVRVYDDRLECFNCGDSQAIVFIDGEDVYKTVMHNYKNEDERKRVKAMGCKFIPSRGITVFGEDDLRATFSERVVFPKTVEIPIYLCLTPTQALGHNSKTGYTSSKHVIPLRSTSYVKVVIASDGVWDMRNPDSTDSSMALFLLTAEEIALECASRWHQPWRMTTLGTPEAPARVLPQIMPLRDFDDVSVIVVESKPGKKDSEEGSGEGLIKEPEEGAGEYKEDGTGTKRRSTKRRSTKRRSTKRRSTKSRSTKRRSTKRRSTKRRSTKRRSTKRR